MGKTSLSNRIIPTLLLLDGVTCALTAIFAYKFGFDPNATWSRSRFVLLFVGVTLIFVVVFFYKNPRSSAFVRVLFSENIKILFLLAHIWAMIFTVYAWFITYGNFTAWDHTTHYYTQLADSFNKGHLYLERKPSKALLESDPNDPNSRPPFSDEVWDLSLYKGKFYLYWGPVPALLIAPIQSTLGVKVTDIFLVYFFLAGLLVFNSLIILNLWRTFFAELPAWSAFVCIPLVGFIMPVLWSLNVPNVYEAAIGAGQFFLIGGVYFALLAFETNLNTKDTKATKGKIYLFLAGLFWACSVGSRAINVLSVIFFAALVSWQVIKDLNRGDTETLRLKKLRVSVPQRLMLFAFFAPLIFGALAVGWHNWARFDSPLEFGLRYQITIFNLNQHLDWIFRPDYFFLNLYNYFFQPFNFISGFPFIKPIINTNFPETYFYAAGPVTGLLFSAPFLILAFYAFKKNASTLYSLFIFLLSGSFLINLLTLLFYFFSQTRFLVDLISQIALLAVLGYWRIVSSKSKVFIAAANLLLVATICVGFLLAFTSETNRIATLNPQVIKFFGGVP